ncbi:hypothetical protein [Blastococcus sp. CT_GayMR16]|uniref:phage major capsid protein n=1 Tax=Blastococcus sp. CT_GayMR16 TaxID=2559607 RepID=UPI0010737984|nr:hypothetical protein [Blastococcus sp. CT_GayMR16]TFV83153.1 hypothetical protein E4P38_21085 [Blastococcus sp. CT_GayMR16]
MTYPPAGPTINGQVITVHRLMNNPILIYRLLRTLVQQRLIGDKLLSGRVDLTGSGSAVFEIAESIFSDLPAERVAALMEYPLTTSTPGTVAVATTDKWGLADEISDELVARSRMDLVMRKLIKLANRIAFQFDQLALSAIGSAVTQTQTAGAAWNVAGADPLLDILLAGAQPDGLNQGYSVNVLAARPVPWARLLAATKVIERAPREGENGILLTGNMVRIAGLEIWKTTNMPVGVDVLAADSTQLGSIAYENIGGGYDGTPGDVESKTIRDDKRDGWRIQARKIAVPMVQEPGAAVKITGV